MGECYSVRINSGLLVCRGRIRGGIEGGLVWMLRPKSQVVGGDEEETELCTRAMACRE